MENQNRILGSQGQILVLKLPDGNMISVTESLRIVTDQGILDVFGDEMPSWLQWSLAYTAGEQFFSERRLTICPKEPLTIFRVEKEMALDREITGFTDHKTFRCASAAAFVRFENAGLFTGFANPFCETRQVDTNRILQTFEPSLILCAEEVFTFDADFTGAYMLRGQCLQERTPRTPLGSRETGYMTRYHNPSLEPLDWAEVRSFQNYTEHYLSPSADRFIYEFYMYFSPVRPQPSTEQDEQDYYRYIDNFVALGGNIIVFQPLQRQTPPSPSGNPWWEIYKPGSMGERIVSYAKSKGLQYGIYMGSAQDNLPYCNSSMNPYASVSEKPNWKKVDALGVVSDENCICCDDFAEWYFEVQKNTIERYRMGFWDWDPGLGNGHFCYSTEHGHLPGKGGYKGFRNTQKIIEKIKTLNGGMYLQAFHGMKEYGLWGMKCFDQHEAYWEQDPGFFATMYPDVSADRVTANGMRLQAWWNQNFRFLPGAINHSLTNRMIQNCNDPQDYLRYLFDFSGWRFALMSALATGASITSPIIPYELESIGMQEFAKEWRSWVDWAKENFHYLKHVVAFGSQPDTVQVDGYARILRDEGFLFLCNGNNVKSQITFCLDGELGFEGEGNYRLKTISPEWGYYFDHYHDTGVFSMNNEITVDVDPFSVVLLQLEPAQKGPCLYGVVGNFCDGKIDAEPAESGSIAKVVLEGASVEGDAIVINGTEIPAQTKNGRYYADVRFGQRQDRYLTNWRCNGMPVSPCHHPELRDIMLQTELFLPASLTDDLRCWSEYGHLKTYAAQYGNEANMGFVWTVPDRIYLVLPFVDAQEVSDIRVLLNGKELPLQTTAHWAITSMKRCCFYCDITDAVQLDCVNDLTVQAAQIGDSMFLGAYLLCPPAKKTAQIAPLSERMHPPVVYSAANAPLVPSDEKNGGVQIVDAKWSRPCFEEYTDITLLVRLSLPPEQVKKVICSCPITIDGYSQLTMNTDRELIYDAETGLWSVKLIIGDRKLLIMDDHVVHIRAIDNNHFADDCILPVHWRYKGESEGEGDG